MNWGTKLAIGMLLFIVFILGMGARMVFTAKDDLVEADYYEKGQSYNSDYEEQQNALNEEKFPVITSSARGISIQFDEALHYEIWCRHPFDASKDIELNGRAVSGQPVVIPASLLCAGIWNLEIVWTSNGLNQRMKQQITLR